MKELELLEYKRDLYFKRDGLTDTVLSLDTEIKTLKKKIESKKKFLSYFQNRVVIKRNMEIDDNDYQNDVDHNLSMSNN